MRRLSIARFWWVPVLLVCTTGCMVRIGGWGGETNVDGVSVRDGVIYYEGTELPFDRWVDVTADMGSATDADISTATGEISLNGVPGNSVSLQVHLHSEFENDGDVRFANGKLEAVEGEGKVYINAVRGTIPEDVSVHLATGTGSISLNDMKGKRVLRLDSGTGPVAIGSSTADKIRVAMGTDEIRITDTSAERIDVETGTGDLRITGGGAGTLEVDTGTGEVYLTNARFDAVVVDSGTGDVVLKECNAGRIEVDSGTGDLILRGGRCDTVELDSGTGDLRIRDGATVGATHEN